MSEEIESGGISAPKDVGGGTQLSAMIDKLLEHPELINMVATTLGKPSGGEDGLKKEGEESEAAAKIVPEASKDSLMELISAMTPVVSAMTSSGPKKFSPKIDRRDCLLSALKPYLCRERCEAIDYMIKLGKISELLKNMH